MTGVYPDERRKICALHETVEFLTDLVERAPIRTAIRILKLKPCTASSFRRAMPVEIEDVGVERLAPNDFAKGIKCRNYL
jgi:hypothetical protein